MNLAWRPPGWLSDPSAPIAAVAEAGMRAKAKHRRGEPLTDADAAAAHDLALLRQCYCTPRWVWRLAGFLLDVEPGGWAGDPFHNEWSHASAFLAPDAWRMEGREGVHLDDGFATFRDLGSARARVTQDESTVIHDALVGILEEWTQRDGIHPDNPAWPGRDPLLVNGPHRKGPRGLAGWVPLAARAGRLRKVAAVVPSDNVGWFSEHGMRCDAEVNLGRMDFDLVPGLPPITGNERCSSLLLWDPDTRGQDVQPCLLEVKDDRGRLLCLPLRPGLGQDPKVIEVPR